MSNCRSEDPFVIIISHSISSGFAIIIYGVAFSVLFFKCPKYFNNQYRNYLIAHIFSGVLLEIHMSVFWRPKVVNPVPILCSNGLSSEYSAVNFQIFIYLLIFMGVSALSILICRMKAVIIYVEYGRFHKLPIYFRRIFYFFSSLTIASTFLINPGLNNQLEYKLKMEQKFGAFPEYFWCQSCIFMLFDSIPFMLFFISSYITITTAFLSAGFTAFVTYRILNSRSLRLSQRTAKIQKNVLSSLIAAVSLWRNTSISGNFFQFMVHVVLIFLPLLAYFSSNFINIDYPSVGFVCVIMVQEHGSCSALTLLITSKLLRNSVMQLFYIPMNFTLCSKDRVSQNTFSTIPCINIFVAWETFKSLKSRNRRLSAKTLAIHRNFLFSLISAIIVHISMIFISLMVYFIDNFAIIDVPYLSFILVILLQDHGSFVTLTMFITTNVVRRATGKLLWFPHKLCGSKQQVQQ
ncbi:hypothetical protein CRE_09017 [Caenorhabditis remanei]|uniref:Uncharacterized protein n=1 Tax=Caenorhabditis remanei TaxID=31234 RepID=E3LIU1_CAERE|nr:hypothetical protein CRE_09017 [Caenorhabditis remanei]